MQSSYAQAFVREMGCTPAEWLGWLPGAVGAHALRVDPAAQTAQVSLGPGRLVLGWMPLEPRVIALLRMPRLEVRFRFEGVDDAVRHDFMRYFDLYMQRGGG